MATLYEKVYGCLAASRVASSMGAAVEGWHADKIKETYGWVNQFYSYCHYGYRGVTWQRMPGTTEDGIERQKLMCRAIIAKGDRITADDLGKVAAEVVDPEKSWFMSEPDDTRLIKFLKTGVAATEVGRLMAWHGTNGVARASHPIGLINACDPESAFRDAADVGRMIFASDDIALVWAGVYDAAIAAACKPDATVASVLDEALSLAPEPVKREINRGLDIVQRTGSFDDARTEFYKIYNGFGTMYAMSSAAETVTKALAMFWLAKGDAKTAIEYGVNMGRDTDCLAAMAGGLSGALSGIGTVPQEWVEQIDKATFANPYTNTQVTIQEHADGIYGAILKRAAKMRVLADLLCA